MMGWDSDDYQKPAAVEEGPTRAEVRTLDTKPARGVRRDPSSSVEFLDKRSHHFPIQGQDLQGVGRSITQPEGQIARRWHGSARHAATSRRQSGPCAKIGELGVKYPANPTAINQ